jgi:hypothetical protein
MASRRTGRRVTSARRAVDEAMETTRGNTEWKTFVRAT